MDVAETVIELCRAARRAARVLATAPTATKNAALRTAAAQLHASRDALLNANWADVERGREMGLSAAMIDRLTLTDSRVDAMAHGIEEVAQLPDPVGETIGRWRRPNGLEISQVRIPLGVVGVIYESRPNVTADAAALCVKAGNAVVLKGGSEALQTNTVIARPSPRRQRPPACPLQPFNSSPARIARQFTPSCGRASSSTSSCPAAVRA